MCKNAITSSWCFQTVISLSCLRAHNNWVGLISRFLHTISKYLLTNKRRWITIIILTENISFVIYCFISDGLFFSLVLWPGWFILPLPGLAHYILRLALGIIINKSKGNKLLTGEWDNFIKKVISLCLQDKNPCCNLYKKL